MKVPRCRGTRDLLPQDMEKFRRIDKGFRECCLGWGYREIKTPVLEYLHLFTSAGTLSPDMLGRVYSFLDWDGWSGERVVLRPDGTIPAARLYAENLQSLAVARLCYVENMFAFEGTGRESRERWQCGAELIGGHKPEGDVELISLALEALSKFGLKSVELRLAHAGLLKAFLQGLGLRGEEEADMLDRIFSGDADVIEEVKGGNPELEKQLRLLFGLKGDSLGFVENLRNLFTVSNPALESSLSELARIADLLTNIGCSYQIDFTSGKGFEYYTGIIFGFYSSGRRLGGGGRYDELIPLVGGKDICASGFALYVDEIMDLLGKPSEREKVLVKAKDAEGLKDSFEMARLLREEGFIAEFDLGQKKTAGFRWIVDMRSGKGIELIERSSGKKQRKSSPAEVLAVMRRRVSESQRRKRSK